MLSGETATGMYPVECVKTMSKIAVTTEKSIKYWKRFRAREYKLNENDYEFNMNYAVCTTAMNISAKAIISYTETGNTCRMVSSFGPECPIFAITSNQATYRQLGLCWSIIPKLFDKQNNIDKLLHVGINKLRKENYLVQGDKVVIAGGTKVLTDLNCDEVCVNRVIGGIVEL